MPRFTRTHARALTAGAATTVLYLAGSRAAGSPRLRAGALFLVAAGGMAGLQSSALSRSNKARLDAHIAATAAAVHFVAHGGSVGGPITASGQITANGGIATNGAGITTSGGSLTTGPITCGTLSMGGTLTMNLHDAFTFGHVTANQIGPGGDRTLLGGQPFTAAGLNAVQARVDFLLTQLEGANICY